MEGGDVVHYKDAKSILSAKNWMNVYRGCTHGCIYCDARSSCYQMKHKFEDVEVKGNIVELLEKTLAKKRKKCMILTGAISDPYIQLELELGYTRKCLEVIERYGFGISVLTKSANVLIDLNAYKRINDKAKAIVEMTITTIDDRLCKILEPNVSVTSERLKALEIFNENGVPTIVWLTPLLPFINDTPENVREIVRACAEVGVKRIISFGLGLTLRDGSREYFYKKLDKYFPNLKEKYIEKYGKSYLIPSPNVALLRKVLYKECKKYGINCSDRENFKFKERFPMSSEQLSIFDMI